LKVIAKSSTVDIKNVGYAAGILSTYLRQERQKEMDVKKEGMGYVGEVGKKISFHGRVLTAKTYPSQYGGTVTLYKFNDLDDNRLSWWTNKKLDLKIGETYPIIATVKSHEVDKYDKFPTTVVKNGKVQEF
jgi:hypothetical protein